MFAALDCQTPLFPDSEQLNSASLLLSQLLSSKSIGTAAFFAIVASMLLVRLRAFPQWSAALRHRTLKSHSARSSSSSSSDAYVTGMGVPLPQHGLHRTLQQQDLGRRTIIVGDVHGCCDELEVNM